METPQTTSLTEAVKFRNLSIQKSPMYMALKQK